MKTTALIYGTPEQEQTVAIEFEGYEIRKFFGNETYFCNYLKVLQPLNFRPSDICQDLTIAIAEALGMDPNDIRIDAEVKFTVKPLDVVPIQHTYDNLILFI